MKTNRRNKLVAATFLALALAMPGVAIAGADSGVCEDTPPAFDIFEDLGDVLPELDPARLVNEPHQRITLCSDVPLVRLDETLKRGDIVVRIPIGSLAIEPMTVENFKAGITDVSVPELWSMDGTDSWKLEGDTLVVVVKDASTWRRPAGRRSPAS
jgi:hypothetical protein